MIVILVWRCQPRGSPDGFRGSPGQRPTTLPLSALAASRQAPGAGIGVSDPPIIYRIIIRFPVDCRQPSRRIGAAGEDAIDRSGACPAGPKSIPLKPGSGDLSGRGGPVVARRIEPS